MQIVLLISALIMISRKTTTTKTHIRKPLASELETDNAVAQTEQFEAEVNRTAEKVKPEMFEMRRFSDRRSLDGGSNPILRVLLFLAVIVIAGVGLILLIQRYMSSQSASTTSSSSSVTSSSYPNSMAITSSTLADSSANPAVSLNSSFGNASLSLGSDTNNNHTITVDKFTYVPYTSFTRVMWELGGISLGLPATTVAYDATNHILKIVFTNVTATDPNIFGIYTMPGGDVTKVTVSNINSNVEFDLTLAENSKYYAFVQSSNGLVIDIKTDTQLTQVVSSSSSSSVSSSVSSSSVSSSTSSASSSVASDTGKPAAPHYTNTASQTKQYVSSAVDGQKLYIDSYYYEDQGNLFEFSWALRNKGEDSIPNATAELITNNGTNYLQVKIGNLIGDAFYGLNWGSADFGSMNLAGTPMKNVTFKSFDNETGTSTYWIELSKKTNFALFDTKTEGNFQLLSIDIYD